MDALLDYRRRAPGVEQALPTHEHFVAVVAAAGAAIDDASAQASSAEASSVRPGLSGP
ncbi:MAG TPA: hypothetical protein VMT03_15935 [Polyangia bacterium]|nr:hypothetical protein [Polyangia bacterium]